MVRPWIRTSRRTEITDILCFLLFPEESEDLDRLQKAWKLTLVLAVSQWIFSILLLVVATWEFHLDLGVEMLFFRLPKEVWLITKEFMISARLQFVHPLLMKFYCACEIRNHDFVRQSWCMRVWRAPLQSHVQHYRCFVYSAPPS